VYLLRLILAVFLLPVYVLAFMVGMLSNAVRGGAKDHPADALPVEHDTINQPDHVVHARVMQALYEPQNTFTPSKESPEEWEARRKAERDKALAALRN